MKKHVGVMKKYVFVIFSLIIATTIVACDKKSNSGKTSRANRFDPTFNNNFLNGNNASAGNWGVIYNNSESMNEILSQFLGSTTKIRFVSGLMDARTGVSFNGRVSDSSGRIDFAIWDEYTKQGENPISFTMNVVNVRESGNGVRIVVEDADGSVTFDGTFAGREYRGRISFNNTDGQSGSLGQFAIDRDALFSF